MVLTGVSPATGKLPAMRSRITWALLPGGRVRQLWDSSPVDKDAWTVQFDGLYEPIK